MQTLCRINLLFKLHLLNTFIKNLFQPSSDHLGNTITDNAINEELVLIYKPRYRLRVFTIINRAAILIEYRFCIFLSFSHREFKSQNYCVLSNITKESVYATHLVLERPSLTPIYVYINSQYFKNPLFSSRPSFNATSSITHPGFKPIMIMIHFREK